jgi:chemotaxis protein methyltransferase CheR
MSIDLHKENYNNEDIEIRLFLEAIYLSSGYDFRNYSPAHIKRRILSCMSSYGLPNISDMQHKVLYDVNFFKTILSYFSINVTDMFRDPSFYKAFRINVIPVLSTYPQIKIWHAGCSTGEEVFSMAIMLKEEGLLERTQIYATDFNSIALQKAEEGTYPIKFIKDYTRNYHHSGGVASFADYYEAKTDYVVFNPSLKRRIIFADHNLVTDGVFGEMNAIICRNVLIYFNKQLQNRVIKLFSDSLCKGGFLCLGSKESLQFSNCSNEFISSIKSEKIFKKKFGD